MVDIMATPTQFQPPTEDFEDGELPEDGEIQDDEEQAQQIPPTTQHVASPARPAVRNSPSQAPVAGLNGQMSPPAKKFAPRGYGEDMEGIASSNRDIWADKASEGNGPEFSSYGGEDRDYRFDDEPYGDFDYRQGPPAGRRRRHSPPDDDYDHRAKRPFPGRPWRQFKPKRSTEHLICKFFREGYCRDGDACTYSHQAEDSLRKPELCRFYHQGFCKKGLTCLALHGEFPCKAYHKGECSRDPCHYSHLPLTDYTRPMFERLLQDDEMNMAPRQGPPHYPQHMPPAPHPAAPPMGGMPPRPAPRRVLLPPPPHPSAGMPPPIIHAPLPQQQTSNGQLAPPSVVVPTLAPSQQPHPHYPMPPHPQMPPGYYPPTSQMHAPSPHREEPAPKPAAAPQFDISQMLAQIAGESEPVDSPASPPMFSGSGIGGAVCSIPDSSQVTWRLVTVDVQPAYSGVDATIAASNDPRMSRVISSQFDAVSSLIASAAPPETASVAGAAAAASVRDPRRRPEDRASTDDRSRVSSWMPQIA